MSEEHHLFMSRVRRLERKHNAMAHGYTARIGSDGLIVVAPQKKLESRMPLRAVVLFLGAFLLFKGFLIASIGLDSYQDRVAKLQAGSVLEQGGSYVMMVDPLSRLISEKIGPVLR